MHKNMKMANHGERIIRVGQGKIKSGSLNPRCCITISRVSAVCIMFRRSFDLFNVSNIKTMLSIFISHVPLSCTLTSLLHYYVSDIVKWNDLFIDFLQAGHVGNPAWWHIVLPKFLGQPLPVRDQLRWQKPSNLLKVLLYLKIQFFNPLPYFSPQNSPDSQGSERHRCLARGFH